MCLKGRLDVAVVVRCVDDRKVEFDDKLMDLRSADLRSGYFPVAIQPAAQRSDASLADAVIILRQCVIAGRRIGDGRRVEAEFRREMLDELLPGRQADAHGKSSAREQDDP